MNKLINEQNEIDEQIKEIDELLNGCHQCLICGKESLTLGIHGRHMKAIHGDPTYHDKWESLVKRKKELLVDKKLIKREIKEIKSVRKHCPHCNKSLTVKMYDRHVNVCEFNLDKKQNFCVRCRIQFPSEGEFKYHLSNKNKNGCSCLRVHNVNGKPTICGQQFYNSKSKINHNKNHKAGFWLNMEAYNKAHNTKEIEIDLSDFKKANEIELTYFEDIFVKIFDKNLEKKWILLEPEIPYSEIISKVKKNIPEQYHNDIYYNEETGDLWVKNADYDCIVIQLKLAKYHSDDINVYNTVDDIVELFREPYVPLPRIQKEYIKCAEELAIELKMA